MLRKIVSALILIPLAALIVLFAVGNRAPVTVALDSSINEPPIFAFAVPLYLLLLSVLIVGVIIGGVAAWMRQSRWRRRARRLAGELRAARTDNETLRRQLPARTAPPPQAPSSIAAIAYRHPNAA